MVFGSFFGARTTCDTVSVFRFSIDRFKGVFVDYCILFILRVFCKKSQIKNYFFYFFYYFFFFETIFFQPGQVTCSRCCTFPVTHVVCMALRAYKPPQLRFPNSLVGPLSYPSLVVTHGFGGSLGVRVAHVIINSCDFLQNLHRRPARDFFRAPVMLHVRVG